MKKIFNKINIVFKQRTPEDAVLATIVSLSFAMLLTLSSGMALIFGDNSIIRIFMGLVLAFPLFVFAERMYSQYKAFKKDDK